MNATDGSCSESNEFGWEDYEELVKDVVAALGASSRVEIECWGRNCLVEGPPGTHNQVDVLLSHSDGMHRYRTAVSCRWRSDKVDIAHVREWAQIVHDTRLSKGVIFSKAGFTSDAVRLAKSLNVGLVELRKPTEEDWGDSISRVIGEVIIDGGLTTWDVHIRGASAKGRSGNDSSGDRLRMTLPLVFEAPGQPARTLMQIAEEAYWANPSQGHYVEDFPDGTVARTPADPQHPLDGQAVASVSFKTRSNPPIRLHIDVNAEDSIRKIMRNVSEDRHYNITADGEIIETH